MNNTYELFNLGILTMTQKFEPEPTQNIRSGTESKIYKYFLDLNLFYPKEPEPKGTGTERNRPE